MTRKAAGCAVALHWMWLTVVVAIPANGEPTRQTTARPSQATRPAGAASADGGENEPELVVVRIAEALIRPLISADVSIDAPVDVMILGSRSRGTSTTQGEIWLDLKPQPQRGSFLVHFRGTTTAKGIAHSGPVTLYTTATTGFWAIKRVHFEVGRGVRADTAVISARTRVRLDGVGTRRGRVIGRVVRRVAYRRFAQSLPAIERVALGNAERRIGDSFKQELNRRLNHMNETLATVRPLLEPYYNSNREYPIFFYTTERHAIFCFGGGKRTTAAVDPPLDRPSSSLVEVWLRASNIHQDRPDAVRQWTAMRDVLRELQQARDLRGITVNDAEIPITMAVEDDWLVVGVGDEARFNAAPHIGE